MRRVLLGMIVTASVLASAEALAAGGLVVLEIAAGPLDRDRVRAEIARELGAEVVAPEDPRAAAAAGTLGVVAKAGSLTVSYRASARAPLVRTVPLPADARQAESVAVLLAGNLARDEAAELVAALRKPDPNLSAFADEVRAFEGGAKAYDETLTSIVRATVATKKKTEVREVADPPEAGGARRSRIADIDAKLAAAEERERRARDVAIVRYEQFVATWQGEPTPELEEARTRLAALYEAAGRHDDAARLRAR